MPLPPGVDGRTTTTSRETLSNPSTERAGGIRVILTTRGVQRVRIHVKQRIPIDLLQANHSPPPRGGSLTRRAAVRKRGPWGRRCGSPGGLSRLR
ncbi:hypothetical protein RHCRD62_70127 [Rhodococcus sp. RD6.2]|nr:hypothetical protein RHCRD62_70127 [Rhodococcus sp. RD6.2]